MTRTEALIVAAGRGARFGGDVPKQYRRLAGQPVLRRTVRAFVDHPAVAGVRAVINPDYRELHDDAVAGLAARPPVSGGIERQDSVRLGLEALAAESPPDRVLIHDAARPLVDGETIARVVAALDDHDGAIAALPVTDTLKRGEEGFTAGTVDRTGLWRAQTPQGFRFGAILEAHRAVAGLALTDDAAVAEQGGLDVALVAGNEDNFKVTTEDDLARAERLLAGGPADVRVGQGFDVHRFAPGEGVLLCGVRIPFDRRLEGHSDADAGLHALTDAILGALGAGDIGQHFPPSDPQWQGADSRQFLEHACGLVRARGGRVAHADVTLICQAPKIGPHRAAMTQTLAGIMGISPGRVGVKATTTEQLGFTGRGEGVAAMATATIRLPGD
jgi:2-C-methyl-D-erythritol 4-phosphate cytidylyltransferase/2-C-methyl-D-erythritol 2,4-cyclodiphosphate synthase